MICTRRKLNFRSEGLKNNFIVQLQNSQNLYLNMLCELCRQTLALSYDE